MTKYERFEGCILGGAIGDAYGSGYENIEQIDRQIYYLFEQPNKEEPKWQITDDTQLTLITCEAILDNEIITAEILSRYLVDFYKQRRIRGIGSSTLKSLQELRAGGHWSQVGRKGEYAAGNGSAMRIAPIGFIEEIERSTIREISSITHKNDEAYIGSLCVVLTIREILRGNWTGEEDLHELLINQIPDTRIRDRMIEIQRTGKEKSLLDIGKMGNTGYVVDSIPLAITAASQVKKIGIGRMYKELIEIGGDTDTNCSIAGQIAGTLIGKKNIPEELLNQLQDLGEYEWIKQILIKCRRVKGNWA